ncbi:MAG: ectoine/hydroxyectoine ABC transporter permease subunit EhuD, partial [Pseudomonadota bacterium]
ILPRLLEGAVVTVYVSLASFLLAVVLGLALAVARAAGPLPVRWVVIGFVDLIRSTPVLIQLFLVFFGGPAIGLSLSPTQSGILTLGVHYACFLSEVYRAGIDAVPRGQREAARALSLPAVDTWSRIILPQAIAPMIPMFGNQMISVIKDSAFVASVSVFELVAQAKLIGSETFRYTEPMTMAGLIFLGLSVLTGWLFRIAERAAKRS